VEGFGKLYRTYGDSQKDANMVEHEVFVIIWKMHTQAIYHVLGLIVQSECYARHQAVTHRNTYEQVSTRCALSVVGGGCVEFVICGVKRSCV
jgi:hypothetical protein